MRRIAILVATCLIVVRVAVSTDEQNRSGKSFDVAVRRMSENTGTLLSLSLSLDSPMAQSASTHRLVC